MLFNMALTTAGLDQLTAEVRRVLRPGGLHVYTVRHTGDAHYGAGTRHGDHLATSVPPAMAMRTGKRGRPFRIGRPSPCHHASRGDSAPESHTPCNPAP